MRKMMFNKPQQQAILMSMGLFLFLCPLAKALVLQGHLSQDATQQAEIETTRKPGIIGVNFEIHTQDYPKIVEVYANTPAAEAGLAPGDEVLAINGISTQGFNPTQVNRTMPHTVGTAVKLTVRRESSVFSRTLIVAGVEQIQSQELQSRYNEMFQQYGD